MAMIRNVGRMFGMRQDEIVPATLLFFYLFLVMGAYLMGQAVGDALFLDKYPKQLPYVMIGSALMAGAFVAVYSRLSARLRLESLVIATLGFFAASFFLFWWLARFQIQWVYWLVIIWVYTAGAICPMMGWTLANYTLTTREARRLFGFIGAGSLLGGAIVSFTTADAVHQKRLQPQTAFLVVAVILLICIPLVHTLFRSAGPRLAAMRQDPAAGTGAPKGFGGSLKLIRSSRFLLMITALVAVGSLTTCILGYQYKMIAREAFPDNKEALTVFFCRFNGYMGLASFIFQAALTPLLLSSLGIRVTLFVTPVALMVSSIGVLAWRGLLTASILRGSHYMLRFSVDKSSTELLYVPVSPDVRSQVKSFIDSFVWRSVDGIAGLILWLTIEVLKFTPSEVSVINIIGLLAWIYVANQVRREYLNVLRQSIERRTLDPERTAAQVLDSTTLEVLAQALDRGGEQQLMYGMSLFEMSRQTGWHPALRRLLDHGSPAVRQQALRLLGDAGDREILAQVEKMLGDESLEVRAEALRYLVVHEQRDPLVLLSEQNNLPAHVIQGAVLTYLSRSAGQEYAAAIRLILEDMVSQDGLEGVPVRCEAARILGVMPSSFELRPYGLKLLRDENPEVVEQALLSAGKIRIAEFLPMVIERLEQPRLRAAARTALVQYDAQAVGLLRSCLNDRNLPIAVRRQIPQTLARIPTSESAVALAHSLLQGDPGLRFEVVKALNELREMDAGLIPEDVDYADLIHAELIGYCRSFQVMAVFERPSGKRRWSELARSSERLLRRAFREHMESELERLFRFLALVYPPRDIHNAFAGLISGRPRLQANALEVMEHLLPQELYRRLANVLDPEADSQHRLQFAHDFCGVDMGSRNDALRLLLHSEDVWLRSCSIYVIGGLLIEELAPEMEKIPCDHDPLLAETRNWAMAQFSANSQG
jgi:ATP:ADP antiporter, AAA family